MSYRLSRPAVRDFIDIYKQSFQRFGRAQAEAYQAKLRAACELIARSPQLARERREIDPPVRVFPAGSHVLVYLVEADGDVRVLRVRHGREDWQAGLAASEDDRV